MTSVTGGANGRYALLDKKRIDVHIGLGAYGGWTHLKTGNDSSGTITLDGQVYAAQFLVGAKLKFSAFALNFEYNMPVEYLHTKETSNTLTSRALSARSNKNENIDFGMALSLGAEVRAGIMWYVKL